MATKKTPKTTKTTRTTKSKKEKSVDLPPKGPRNADPITDAPGSHPIETGVGAVIGGAASGLAVGAVGGPMGAVVGAIAGGAVAGGLAGKGIGELIDPTTEDNWLREYYSSSKHKKGETVEVYRPAYQFGVAAVDTHQGRSFDEAEADIRSGWEKEHGTSGLDWDRARGAVRDAYDRTIRLREEQLHADKTREETGDVKVRKEVHTEHKTITVPVEREEVVIEHRPAAATADTSGSIKAEEIRIPVSEEKVHARKETVAKEEVHVGKRKVHDTETVGGDVRSEHLVVEKEGDIEVRDERGGHTKA
jgi:uncharacterized protein (TIGR02271 family)